MDKAKLRDKVLEPARSGLLKSLKVLWLLFRIIIPISIMVKAVEHFNLVEPLSAALAPVMAWSGLPGEAAIPLALGFFVNFYASMGAITSMAWSSREITIMGVMLGICHELPVEAAVCSYTGLKFPVSVVLRLGTALAAGAFLNLLYTLAGG